MQHTHRSRLDLLYYLLATAIPLALLGTLVLYLIQEQFSAVDSVRKEQRGIQTVHDLYHVAGLFQKMRGKSLLEDPEGRHAGGMASVRTETDEMLREMLGSPGTAEFGIHDAIQHLIAHSSPAASGTLADGGQFSDAAAEALLAMQVVADHSGLILDPVLDVHYLVDLGTRRLGSFVEGVGLVRATAVDHINSAITRTQPDEEERMSLRVAASRLSTEWAKIHHDLNVLTEVAPHLSDGFRPFSIQLQKRVTRLTRQLAQLEAATDAKTTTRIASDVLADGTALLLITEILHDRAISLTQLALSERSKRLEYRTRVSILGGLLMGVVIVTLITLYYRTNRRRTLERDTTIHTLDALGRAQGNFIAGGDPGQAYENLLEGVLEATGSAYGFVAEVLRDDSGAPYLKSRALTNIAWNDDTRKLYDEQARNGLEFHNLKTLFGAALTSGQPVISNDPAHDERSGGLPPGHPPMTSFLGVPAYRGNELIAMIAVANRPQGYDHSVVRAIQPYLATCVQMISAHRSEAAVRDSEERHRSVLNTMVDAVVVIDEQGLIRQFNPGAERIFGYRVDEVMGRNLKILMPEPYQSEHDGYLERYRRTGEARILGIGREVVALRKNGETFPADLSVAAMDLGGERLYTGIVRDITERRRIDRMKSEFISTVSHELRTPLTSIRGAIGLLEGNAGGELPHKAREILSIASNNTQRLLLLINDILDIDKIESGQMPFRFQRLDLGTFLREAVRTHTGYAAQHGVTMSVVHVDDNLAVNADPDRLMQVLANLLSNAAKFSPQGATVDIEATREGSSARITVKDCGPGIPESFQPRVFEKFSQHDATDSRRAGGTGLGLSIARAIIGKHGGHIGFDTVEGQGTTFWLNLPALDQGMRPPRIEPNAQVLIVESNPNVARVLRGRLAAADIAANIATSGEEARRMLEKIPYRLLTLDLALPGQGGLQFLQALRRDPATRNLPVVIISARTDQNGESGESGQEATPEDQALLAGVIGIVDWLEKPVDEERLLAAVRQATRPPDQPRVLHVEDETDVRDVVRLLLAGRAEVTAAATLTEASSLLLERQFDLVLLDQLLPDGLGTDLLPLIEHQSVPPRVVIFSALEVNEETAQRVHATLMKSTTSNERLLATIRTHLVPPQSRPTADGEE
ncbi:MAG: PAS domain S-box protein [Nitrospirota bacterium]|nr:PAS domain S-box protein [Nitrospirota bacterium]